MSIVHGTLPGRAEELARAAKLRLAPIEAEYPFQPNVFLHGSGLAQHYVDEGPRDGEVLVFLHGNPTWSFAWRTAIRRLSTRYRCIAVDHIGCGLSDKPADHPYRLSGHVEHVEALLGHLDVERVTLVLHDWGGAIGMGYARRHPERVERLVLMNTAAFLSDRMPLRIAACRVPVFGRLAVQGLNAFARAATFMAVEQPLPPLVKRGYLLPYDSWSARIATHRFVEDIPMKPGHPSYEELGWTGRVLGQFGDRPTLLAWGMRDWCFTPHFLAEWQERLPRAEVRRFEQAGHYVFEDAREELVETVEDFLARNPQGSRVASAETDG